MTARASVRTFIDAQDLEFLLWGATLVLGAGILIACICLLRSTRIGR
jgi:hypothetical protein